MCISNTKAGWRSVRSVSTVNYETDLPIEEFISSSQQIEEIPNPFCTPKLITRRKRSSNSISEFRSIPMRKSLSFSGIGATLSPSGDLDLDELVDGKKNEPTKLSKERIKEYAAKYKDAQGSESSEKRPAWYREAVEHTQPAHAVVIVAVLWLAFRLFPDSSRSASEASTLTRLLYVGSIATCFGAQAWMTFISGLALFFCVPRHVFGQVQTVLFPIYFFFNSVLMIIAVLTYTQHHPTSKWDLHQTIQGAMLVLSLMANLLIRLYLSPPLIKLITIKMAIEKEAGLGSEIGSSKPGILGSCPHYMKIHKAFRKVHITIAMGNMVAMGATAFHLYYLATKLCSATAMIL